MDKEKKEIVIYDTTGTKYGKSNLLIGSKYRSSLLENKIMAISLSKIQKKEYSDEGENGGLVCELKASELRELLGANAGSFYAQLDPVAHAMTSRSIGYTDPENHRFEYMAVITNAKYENGTLTIKYNHSLKKYINNLDGSFTLLSLPTMLSFKHNYSFRLYELLRSRAYSLEKNKNEDTVYKIVFSLSELKLDMGIVNAELDSVRRVLNNTENPDYDKAVEKSPEQLFKTWYEFRRRVLEPAILEINNKTEISCSYEAQKSGKGSKVHGIIFYVQYKDPLQSTYKNVEEVTLTEDEELEFFMNVRNIIKEKLSIKELRSISKAANYDMNKIANAYEIMKKSKTEIDNITGWMIQAIKEEYKMHDGKKSSGKTFPNKRKYDYEVLEDILLS